MKKILTVLMVLIATICTAFAFGACDLFGTGDKGGGTTDSGNLSDGSGSDSTGTGNGNTSGGNTSGGNTSGGNTSGGNTSGGNFHTCVFVFTERVDGCVTNGYDLYTCNDPTCGKTEKHNSYAPVGHAYKHETYPATCTSNAGEADVCTRCKDTKNRRTYENTKLEHAYAWTETASATCTTDGSKSGACPDCGATKTEVIPANGHDYGTYVQTTAPTCLTDAIETAVCSACQNEVTRTVVGSSLGHSYGAYQVEVAATCEVDGRETKVCSTCQASFSRTIAATGHDYVASNMNNYPATCERAGKETKVCTVCKKTTSKDLPALGHSFVSGICKECGVYEASLNTGLIFTDRGSYVEVTGFGTASGNVVIPATYNGKPVTGFGWVFNGYSKPDVDAKLTGLVIPDSITSIPSDGCFGCTNLESVTIGSGVTELVYNAFGGCTKLKTITFGTSITSINEAFRGCTSVDTIIFNGTKAQWNAITKVSGWDSSFGSYTVKCTDGNI